jgi:NTP pyrophosphatase (non-canonical NTP hydrolase)
MDKTSTVEQLKHEAVAFRDRRNWKQFHDVKNLSMGLSIEAAELQELFLWKTADEIDTMLASATDRKKVEEELADVFVFLLYLSDVAKIDLSNAVRAKISENEKKYPVDRSYNSSKKYTEF